MTVIAGLVHEGRVLIGGDSAGVSGWQITIRADPKVFVNGDYVLGFTSSFRMGQLLRWSFQPPAPPKDPNDLHWFMTIEWVNALRSCLQAGGWAKRRDEREEAGIFLVGVAGHLFLIDGDYQVGVPADGYHAVGAGEEFAIGALHATAGFGMAPEARVVAALTAAEHHCGAVRSPFTLAWEPRPTAAPEKKTPKRR